MNYLLDTCLCFLWDSHFGRSAKEIVLKFMVHILFFLAWLSFQIDPKQNSSVDIYSQFMIFTLPAGICSEIIYHFSEGQ